MGKLPYFPFYPGDWLKDTELSMCSPASRGIWIDALCAMHVSGTYMLEGTPDQLSRVLRLANVLELHSALEELKTTKTAIIRYDGHGRVTVISRRFEREHKDRENNNLRKKKERSHGEVTEESRYRSRRSHNPSSYSSSSSKEKNKNKKENSGPVPLSELLADLATKGADQ